MLSGDIGSGKTSLLYAIEMGLFGFAEVDPGFLVRHRAREAEVVVTLAEGTHRWELRRRFVRKTRKGRESFEPEKNSLAVDGAVQSYSATELRRRTIELLGFPDNPNPRAHSDVWRWAVYVPQERMRDVLDPDPDSRLATVRKALGIEQYRLAAENAHAVSRELSARGADLGQEADRHAGLDAEFERWDRERREAERALAEELRREATAHDRLADAEATLERSETRRRALETDRQELELLRRLGDELQASLENERAGAEQALAQIAELRERIDRETAPPDLRESLEARREGLTSRREATTRELGELESLRGRLSGEDERLHHLGETERRARDRVRQAEREEREAREHSDRLAREAPQSPPTVPAGDSLEMLRVGRAQAEEERRTLERSLAEAEREVHELSELVSGGICPRCRRPVAADEFLLHRTEAESIVAPLRVRVGTISERLTELDRQIEAYEAYVRERHEWELVEDRRDAARKLTEAATARVVREREALAGVDADRAELERSRATLARATEGFPAVGAELARLDRSLAALEEELREITAREERVRGDLRQVGALEERLVRHRDQIEAIERRRSELAAQRQEIEGRLAPAAETEREWSAARRLRDEARSELERALREVGSVREKFGQAEAHREEIARRLQEREALRARAGHLHRLGTWLEEAFRPAMQALEQRRLARARGLFELRFARYFASLVEDPGLTAHVDETFGPWVEIEGEATPAEALSGGERTALALAYRLALGRVVREAGRLALETLILDEPTEGFSQEQTLRMGELLEELALPQVILVSHEPQLAAIADRVVRVRKHAGVSRLEEVDEVAEWNGRPAVSSTAGTQSPRRRSASRSGRVRPLIEIAAPDPAGGRDLG